MHDLRYIIDKLIDEKLLNDENFLRFTFYEVRIKNKITSEQEKEFLKLTRTKLDWMNYIVYGEGEEFIYNDAKMRVQPNELLIAVKKNKGDRDGHKNK